MEELKAHTLSNSADSDSAGETLAFLSAMNKLFERGFLSKRPVFDEGSPVMHNINEGYKYFVSWLEEIKRGDANFSITATKESPFLAWQTWDLLRICVFGIMGLLKDFKQRHPDNFLVFSRVNGSAIESVFSQIKYATAGKLSSANYASSRRAVIVSSNVQSNHALNVDYRDEILHI